MVGGEGDAHRPSIEPRASGATWSGPAARRTSRYGRGRSSPDPVRQRSLSGGLRAEVPQRPRRGSSTRCSTGILVAHPTPARRDRRPRAIVRADAPVAGKVGDRDRRRLGPPAGLPGLRRRGAADGAAVGNVFASPSAEQMLEVTRAIDGGAGVLYIYGNYGGDVMNFDLAAELADAEDIAVRDGARAPTTSPPRRRSEAGRRRGIAGIFFLYKIAGAARGGGAVARRGRGRRPSGRPATCARWASRSRLHAPGGRPPDLRAARRRDGDRHGHPRRARRPARAARAGRRIADELAPRSSPTCRTAAATR